MIQQTRESGQFPLRLPSELREEIKASASENGRSMNSEIVFQLMRAFRKEGVTSTKKADALA
ncbi:Arc family DNA-binding protein [Neorhizobium sp. CSC1952]|uniref:Arc family DNA-binding protein n=1 Tax=Neorhizobium sp. CSC1952 TaxID=2978974 RepID=UPI0025A5F387|nr:Arc family DNA-binding protein [Rhizobium sp. CSC1952]WJR67649.1 Arc family DNA-binding protein [Rhizobium sp. CSC1952]